MRLLVLPTLSRDALIELRSPVPVTLWIALVWLGAQRLPQRRLAQMSGSLADHHCLGDEGNDPHLATALRAQERKHLIDACQQQRLDMVCRFEMKRLIIGVDSNITSCTLVFADGEIRFWAGGEIMSKKHNAQSFTLEKQ